MVHASLFNKSEYEKFGNTLIENKVDKFGRCPFPSPQFSLTGLESTKSYQISLALKQVGTKFVYKNNGWQPTFKSEHYDEQSVQYELGTATGQQIMENEFIGFDHLRISNHSENSKKKAIIVVRTMHKYTPVLRIHEVYKNENDEWKKVNEQPIEFCFEETSFIAVTAYKNIKIRDLKTDMNQYAQAGRIAKRRREEGFNEAKRRCVEQERRPIGNVVQPSPTHESNVAVLPKTVANFTPSSNPMHQNPMQLPNTLQNENHHSYQHQYTSESSQSKPSTAHVPPNRFGPHQTPNIHTNQFNLNNNMNYPNYNTGSHLSTSALSQHYFSLSFHSTNGNQFNSQNNNTGPHHLNTFPTPPHQDNTPFPPQPVDANQINSHYNHRTYSMNAYPTPPHQNSFPNTFQHNDNNAPAMFNPTPETNHLPYNSEFNHQVPLWLNYNTSTSQPQQAPQNFNQQFQYPPHN